MVVGSAAEQLHADVEQDQHPLLLLLDSQTSSGPGAPALKRSSMSW